MSAEISCTRLNIINLSGTLNDSKFTRPTACPALCSWPGEKDEVVHISVHNRVEQIDEDNRGESCVKYICSLWVSRFRQPGHKA